MAIGEEFNTMFQEAITWTEQEPIMAGAIGIVALGMIGYFAFMRVKSGSGGSVAPSIEPHDRVPIEQKVKSFYEKKLKQDGEKIDRAIRHGNRNLGIATEMTSTTVHSDIMSVEEKSKFSSDDDEEEESDEVEVYVFKIAPSGTISNATSYLMSEVFNKDSARHIRVVKKDWVIETGGAIHIPSEVEFMEMGGLQIEMTVEGINCVSDVVLMKTLERNLNNIEEYVKKINHWSDNYSQDMGRYEKEIEADERRFGGMMNNR